MPLEYDIYLSHSTKDAEIASMVEAKFRASKPGIRIYKSEQVLDDDIDEETEGFVSQEDIFKIIPRCARVVPSKVIYYHLLILISEDKDSSTADIIELK